MYTQHSRRVYIKLHPLQMYAVMVERLKGFEEDEEGVDELRGGYLTEETEKEIHAAADAGDSSFKEDALQVWNKGVAKAKSMAKLFVTPAMINANIQIGMSGFHRAETTNLEWESLSLHMYGANDNYAGKRRNEGPLHAEGANYLHTRYGPFCWEAPDFSKAIPLEEGDTLEQVLTKLLSNLQGWLRCPDAQGTCPLCAFAISNIFCNILYHAQNFELGHSPRDISSWAMTSRPQQGFVWPLLVWNSRSVRTPFDTGVTVVFMRGKEKRAADLQTKYVRMMMEAAYGAPQILDKIQGPVYVRFVSNVGQAHMRRSHATSHTVKRASAKNAAWSGSPLPVLTGLGKHQNKPTAYMYQEMETVEYNDFRQALNAPSHLRPRSRAFSGLDAVAAIRTCEVRTLQMMGALVEKSRGEAMAIAEGATRREAACNRMLMSLLTMQANGLQANGLQMMPPSSPAADVTELIALLQRAQLEIGALVNTVQQARGVLGAAQQSAAFFTFVEAAGQGTSGASAAVANGGAAVASGGLASTGAAGVSSDGTSAGADENAEEMQAPEPAAVPLPGVQLTPGVPPLPRYTFSATPSFPPQPMPSPQVPAFQPQAAMYQPAVGFSAAGPSAAGPSAPLPVSQGQNVPVVKGKKCNTGILQCTHMSFDASGKPVLCTTHMGPNSNDTEAIKRRRNVTQHMSDIKTAVEHSAEVAAGQAPTRELSRSFTFRYHEADSGEKKFKFWIDGRVSRLVRL